MAQPVNAISWQGGGAMGGESALRDRAENSAEQEAGEIHHRVTEDTEIGERDRMNRMNRMGVEVS